MSTKNTKKNGFTIIEVVLVLAIAGLIFLMVFIALPALQRSQRDSARRTEVGAVASAITSYMSNNRNNIPTAANIVQYITGESTGANQVPELESGIKVYVISLSGDNPDLAPAVNETRGDAGDQLTVYADQIKVFFGYKCEDGGALSRGTSRQSAVAVALESGPAVGSIYCQTN